MSDIIDKYGYALTRKPYDVETADIDSLLGEIGKNDFSILEATGVLRWPPIIDEANTTFKEVSKTYISETNEASNIESASEIAPELINMLEAYYFSMLAYIQFNSNDELVKKYGELEVLVDSMR